MEREKAAFDRARNICLAMPGVEERHPWGFPTFRVGGKMFATIGTRNGGPHLAFKVAEHSIASDDRFKLVRSVGSWKGVEDWYFYYFDWERKDDWEQLEHLLAVSWELHFAQLPKKKQDAILSPAKGKAAHGAQRRRGRR